MSLGEPLPGHERKCPTCGKKFWARAEWAYKTGYNGCTHQYYCSWSCLQTSRKKREEAQLRKLLPDFRDRKERG